MIPSADTHRDVLAEADYAHLAKITRGIEKEGLRVNPDSGMLAQTPHPEALGAALTHASITTDYSESLLEFITPVSDSIDRSLAQLSAIHRFTASQLDGEVVWGASMPCIVSGEQGIPIASFGSSNVGTMKRVYRNGLGVRYGRMMQAIAGIHYNFSMPDSFWEASWDKAGCPGDLQSYKTEGYLGLIRNFNSRVWLLIYLLGASPAVCASFLKGNRNHNLVPFEPTSSSLHLPYATSLRMGDLGYNSDAQSSLQICYNSLDNYVATLHQAIVTPHAAYRDYKLTEEGEKAQLNDSLLQIENEFYSPIRPKRVTRSGEAPLVALQRAGIEYIEVRCVDINPFLPLGIDADTIRIIDMFLLDCLLADSPVCNDEVRGRNQANLRSVVNLGRTDGLTLETPEGQQPFRELAHGLLGHMGTCAAMLDSVHGGQEYASALDSARERVDHPELTPSGRILKEMGEDKMPFWSLALKYSRRWHRGFLEEPLTEDEKARFEQESLDSLAQQRAIEAADDQPFEDYLANFYAQYKGVVF